MRRIAPLAIFLLTSLFSMIVSAHPGLTDRNDCHTEDDGTNYHCHKQEVEGAETSEKLESKRTSDSETAQNDSLSYRNSQPQRSHRRPAPVKMFDDQRALVTLGLSFSAITLTSVLAGASKPKHFEAIALPTLGSGLITTSVFSLQVGLKSKTAVVGALPVLASAILPFILAGNYE